FYGSVDLRNSGFKLAPVDTNLLPGGFNNLNPDFHPLCVQAAMAAIEKVCPDARGAVLIPENHTRNQFYLQNVALLQAILRDARDSTCEPAACCATLPRPLRSASQTAPSCCSNRWNGAATAWQWTDSTRAWSCLITTSRRERPKS